MLVAGYRSLVHGAVEMTEVAGEQVAGRQHVLGHGAVFGVPIMLLDSADIWSGTQMLVGCVLQRCPRDGVERY